VSFDDNSEPVKREDGNTTTTGIKNMYKATRGDGCKLTVSLELTAPSTLDLLARLRDRATVAVAFQVGTAVGKTGAFFADYCEVDTLSYGDADGIATVDVTFACVKNPANDTGDNEFEFIMF